MQPWIWVDLRDLQVNKQACVWGWLFRVCAWGGFHVQNFIRIHVCAWAHIFLSLRLMPWHMHMYFTLIQTRKTGFLKGVKVIKTALKALWYLSIHAHGEALGGKNKAKKENSFGHTPKQGKTNSPSQSLHKQVDTDKNTLTPAYVHLQPLAPTHLHFQKQSVFTHIPSPSLRLPARVCVSIFLPTKCY